MCCAGCPWGPVDFGCMVQWEMGQTASEVIIMSKQGMARPDWTHTKPRNEAPPVPEIQGKAKHGKKSANPIISGTHGPEQKVYHTEKPISKVYPVIDNDLARDNVENDIPAADLEDL